MARTKASVGAKVSSGKSSKARCSAAPQPSTSSGCVSGEKSSRSHGGGNPVCPQPTPKWQRPITNFFNGKPVDTESSISEDDCSVSGSTSKPKKRNIIESDEEDAPATDDRPVNKELDDTIELQPLTGERNHKIVEYYPKNDVHSENGENHAQNGETHDKNGENHAQNKENLAQNGENHVENGENPIKIDKGKGKGKKTNKKNDGNNTEEDKSKRKSTKRDLDSSIEEESERFTKKVKVN